MNKHPKPQNDLTGMILGSLTVIKQDIGKKTKEKGTHWICKCKCGEEISVSRNNLKPFAELGTKATRSCGCMRLNRMERDKVLWKKAYCAKINNTTNKRKGHKIGLSEQEFKDIASKPCHYCGLPFSCTIIDSRWVKGKEIKMTDFEIRLNGIDRIDSNGGYTKENCVSCCVNCNQAKNTLTQQQFAEHIKRIYFHFCKN